MELAAPYEQIHIAPKSVSYIRSDLGGSLLKARVFANVELRLQYSFLKVNVTCSLRVKCGTARLALDHISEEG